MADQVEPGGFHPYDSGMEARVAVLEHIAQTTAAAIERIERRLDGMQTEYRGEMRDLRRDVRTDFRWLLGIMLGGFAGLLGVMAHGFHWF